MKPLRVLVVTIVHQPLDARIHARQIRAMREAGWQVAYAAPWSDTDTARDPHLRTIDLPRAVGRHRLGPVLAARRLLREQGPSHDLILLHDPELLVSTLGLRGLPPLVWDVHEDVVASLRDRDWIPAPARGLLGAAVRLLERWAERRHHVLLAETSYLGRFRRPHQVVRNLPWVPTEVAPPGPGRAVYLGRISRSRGLDELLAVADLVQPDVTVELIGPADPDVEAQVARAHDDGQIAWHGFLGNDEALQRLDGATVGLSLLRDEPNYRRSLPTKVAEYMARGVPVVTTPLPEAVRLVEPTGAGQVVPFGAVRAVADEVASYHRNPERRLAAGAAGYAAARDSLDWNRASRAFLDHLLQLAESHTPPPSTH